MSLDAIEIIKQKHDKNYKDLTEQSAGKYKTTTVPNLSKQQGIPFLFKTLSQWKNLY
jgi:hypothetical protein